MEVYNNNSKPQVIGSYYNNAVTNVDGCSKFLLGDFRTLNSNSVPEFQRLLRRNREQGLIGS